MNEGVLAFIRREVPPALLFGDLTARMTEGTDLRNDLRMAEEDADEFLAKLFREFSIAPGDFDFTRYFPSEGLWLLPTFGLGKGRPAPRRLTIGMLVRAAETGVWHTSTIEGAQ
jgi:Protein of unknown function (DUF1493)